MLSQVQREYYTREFMTTKNKEKREFIREALLKDYPEWEKEQERRKVNE